MLIYKLTLFLFRNILIIHLYDYKQLFFLLCYCYKRVQNSENFFLTLINDDNDILFPVLSTGYERGKALRISYCISQPHRIGERESLLSYEYYDMKERSSVSPTYGGKYIILS